METLSQSLNSVQDLGFDQGDVEVSSRLSQEIIRILKNTSGSIREQVKVKQFSRFSMKLMLFLSLLKLCIWSRLLVLKGNYKTLATSIWTSWQRSLSQKAWHWIREI